MAEHKHAPTPWYQTDLCADVFDNKDQLLIRCEDMDQDNLTWAVHCVNLHDELVDALGMVTPAKECSCHLFPEIKCQYCVARDVLAKAKVNDDEGA